MQSNETALHRRDNLGRQRHIPVTWIGRDTFDVAVSCKLKQELVLPSREFTQLHTVGSHAFGVTRDGCLDVIDLDNGRLLGSAVCSTAGTSKYKADQLVTCVTSLSVGDTPSERITVAIAGLSTGAIAPFVAPDFRPLPPLRRHVSLVSALAVSAATVSSAHAEALWSASADTTVCEWIIYALPPSAPTAPASPPPPPIAVSLRRQIHAHTGPVRALAAGPHGFASGSADNTLRLWTNLSTDDANGKDSPAHTLASPTGSPVVALVVNATARLPPPRVTYHTTTDPQAPHRHEVVFTERAIAVVWAGDHCGTVTAHAWTTAATITVSGTLRGETAGGIRGVPPCVRVAAALQRLDDALRMTAVAAAAAVGDGESPAGGLGRKRGRGWPVFADVAGTFGVRQQMTSTVAPIARVAINRGPVLTLAAAPTRGAVAGQWGAVREGGGGGSHGGGVGGVGGDGRPLAPPTLRVGGRRVAPSGAAAAATAPSGAAPSSAAGANGSLTPAWAADADAALVSAGVAVGGADGTISILSIQQADPSGPPHGPLCVAVAAVAAAAHGHDGTHSLATCRGGAADRGALAGGTPSYAVADADAVGASGGARGGAAGDAGGAGASAYVQALGAATAADAWAVWSCGSDATLRMSTVSTARARGVAAYARAVWRAFATGGAFGAPLWASHGGAHASIARAVARVAAQLLVHPLETHVRTSVAYDVAPYDESDGTASTCGAAPQMPPTRQPATAVVTPAATTDVGTQTDAVGVVVPDAAPLAPDVSASAAVAAALQPLTALIAQLVPTRGDDTGAAVAAATATAMAATAQDALAALRADATARDVAHAAALDALRADLAAARAAADGAARDRDDACRERAVMVATLEARVTSASETAAVAAAARDSHAAAASRNACDADAARAAADAARAAQRAAEDRARSLEAAVAAAEARARAAEAIAAARDGASAAIDRVNAAREADMAQRERALADATARVAAARDADAAREAAAAAQRAALVSREEQVRAREETVAERAAAAHAREAAADAARRAAADEMDAARRARGEADAARAAAGALTVVSHSRANSGVEEVLREAVDELRGRVRELEQRIRVTEAARNAAEGDIGAVRARLAASEIEAAASHARTQRAHDALREKMTECGKLASVVTDLSVEAERLRGQLALEREKALHMGSREGTHQPLEAPLRLVSPPAPPPTNVTITVTNSQPYPVKEVTTDNRHGHCCLEVPDECGCYWVDADVDGGQ